MRDNSLLEIIINILELGGLIIFSGVFYCVIFILVKCFLFGEC